MTRRPTRRDVLAASAPLALSVAGCLGSHAGDVGSNPGSGAAPAATPVGPGDWPVIRWERQLAARQEEVLVHGATGRVYLLLDAERANYVAYGADGRRLWDRSLSFGQTRTTTDDGFVVAMLADDKLVEIDGRTGEEQWSVAVDDATGFPVVVPLDGDVYTVAARVDTASTRIDSEFARLCRVDQSSGDLEPLTDLPGEPMDTWRYGRAIGGVLYLGRDDGLVVAYDPDGSERWRQDLRTGEEEPTVHTETVTEEGHREKGEPVGRRERTTGENLDIQFGGVGDETLYVGVEGGLQTVHALAIDSGEIRWESRGYGTVASVTSDRVVLSGGDDHAGYRFAAVDPQTHGEQWTRTIGWSGHAPHGVSADGLLYAVFSGTDGRVSVHAIDVGTGDTVSEFTRDAGVVRSAGVVAGRLVVATTGDETGRLFATPLLDASR